MNNFDVEQVTEFFTYLDGLRISGVTNMFGAAPYLAEEFEFENKKDARAVLTAWMNTFDDSPAEDRAKRALENVK